MANQIATFFAGEDRETAVAATADHLRKFWDPRMRAEIIAHGRAGGEGLSEVARQALLLVTEDAAAKAPAAR
jgi:formate dehydrogenase subunit delta